MRFYQEVRYSRSYILFVAQKNFRLFKTAVLKYFPNRKNTDTNNEGKKARKPFDNLKQ